MITRFAPSPTGPLHLGHAYSALTVWKIAAEHHGTALLRIEDTDSTRVRSAHEDAIYNDLKWLGLTWPTPVRRQSEHQVDYDLVIEKLAQDGFVYPCSCTRREIMNAGAQAGADGMVYPGTCRDREMADAKPGDAIRLNVTKASPKLAGALSYIEKADTINVNLEQVVAQIGDPVLRRKGTGDPSYHLACVHDDTLQNITHVVRGMDLQELTPLHVVMQKLLDYPTPTYHHHALITGTDGKRLAKIDHSKALSKYRAEGVTPSEIKAMIGFVD